MEQNKEKLTGELDLHGIAIYFSYTGRKWMQNTRTNKLICLHLFKIAIKLDIFNEYKLPSDPMATHSLIDCKTALILVSSTIPPMTISSKM